jgi:transporter family protein
LSWTPLILGSALLLAAYDICKKHSVHANAVMPVLFLATLCGSAVFALALALGGRLVPALQIESYTFWQVAFKATLVASSWVFMYYAMRALPISVAAPIRASSPLWTLIGAILLYGEIPSRWQAAGMAAVFAGYWLFSVAGRAEGIHFSRHRGVLYAFLGTVLGAASALYDKHLLQGCQVERHTLQLWFSLDLVVLLGLALAVQRLAGMGRTAFQWRWTIPAVGVLLIVSDWLYFNAVSQPAAHISVLSLVRRSSVIVSFALGALLFGEGNLRRKSVALAAVLIGVAILCLARSQ